MSTGRVIVVLWLAAAVPLAAQSPTYGVGRPPTPDEIRGLGAAIAPDGAGLPEGSGTVAAGRELYAAHDGVQTFGLGAGVLLVHQVSVVDDLCDLA